MMNASEKSLSPLPSDAIAATATVADADAGTVLVSSLADDASAAVTIAPGAPSPLLPGAPAPVVS